jgi:hypothetical protein
MKAQRIVCLLVLSNIVVGTAADAQTPKLAASPQPTINGFPNTPEGAYKALLYAIARGDEPGIRAVCLRTAGLQRLLEINRVSEDKLPALKDRLMKSTAIRRLVAGDTVHMEDGEIYAVKPSEVTEGLAVIRDGTNGKLPIRCRVVEGTWKVDARLLSAMRPVAGVPLDNKTKGLARRAVPMPSPLNGPAYPNTPEGAFRTFIIAYLTADSPNLHAVALPQTTGFEWLLTQETCSFDQASKLQADIDRRPVKTHNIGDVVAVGARKVKLTANDINQTRKIVSIDLPGYAPMPCELVDGHWWVDPRPMILSLKVKSDANVKPASGQVTTPSGK